MRQTVTEYLETWITLRAGGHKPRTVERERDLLSHYITPKVGKIAVKRLKPRQIADMLAEICDAGHTRTAEQVFVFLRSAMPDMMAKVPRPQHTPRRREVLSPVDQRRLLPAVMADPRALEIMLAWVLGLRRGEIRGLRWQDVDLTGRVVHVCNQRQRIRGRDVDLPPKSSAGVRDMPIPGPLMPLFRARARIGGYVTTLSDSGLRGALQRVCVRAGVPYVSLHALRHTMATNATRAGVSMRVLQAELGHASMATTAAIYAHTDMDMLAQCVDAAWRVVSTVSG